MTCFDSDVQHEFVPSLVTTTKTRKVSTEVIFLGHKSYKYLCEGHCLRESFVSKIRSTLKLIDERKNL